MPLLRVPPLHTHLSAIITVFLHSSLCRRWLQAKRRGRRKGSVLALTPEIQKQLGDANLMYAMGRYDEVPYAFERQLTHRSATTR